MDLNSSAKSFSELFDPQSNITYAIPEYQRSYSWKNDNICKLIEDIEENAIGYYIGNFLLMEQPSGDNLNYKKIDIIDGQQRITSLNILWIAIYKTIKLNLKEKTFTNAEEKEDLQGILIEIKKRCLLKQSDKFSSRIELLDFKEDNDCYLWCLNDSGILLDKIPRIKYMSSKKIITNYQDCLNYFKEYELNKLLDLYKKICNTKIIYLTTNNLSDAYLIFESLNFKGVPLNFLDLMKIVYLKTKNADYKKWINMIESIESDDFSDIWKFILNNYEGFVHVWKEQKQLNLINNITKSDALNEYKKLFDNFDNFIDELKENASIFNCIIFEKFPENSINQKLLELNLLDASQTYHLLIFLFKFANVLELNVEQRKTIIFSLITFFVRRNITNFPQARDVRQIFRQLIKEISNFKFKSNCLIEVINKTIKDNMAKDDLVRTFIKDQDIYTTSPGLIRVIFSYLENAERTKENLIDFEKRNDDGKYIFTIEHILPEGKNLPTEWVEMIKDDIHHNIQNKYCHKLGNLTLTGYNSTLSNDSFDIKKNKLDQNGNKIGFNNGLKINKYVYEQQIWSPKEINKRTEDLCEKLISIFNIK